MARDWVNYNEALVKRGEILIDLDFLKNWNKEHIFILGAL